MGEDREDRMRIAWWGWEYRIGDLVPSRPSQIASVSYLESWSIAKTDLLHQKLTLSNKSVKFNVQHIITSSIEQESATPA